MGKITRNYIYNIAYQMLVLLTPLIISPYLVRVLGSENLGIYSYVCSAANIIVSIGLLGTYNYGTRQIAYFRDDTRLCSKTYNEIFTLRICLGVLSTVAYGILIAFEKQFFVYFVVYYMWVVSMIADPSWLFVGQEDMKATAIKNAGIKVSTVILILLLVNKESDLILYVAIMSGSALIANLLLYTQIKQYNIHIRLDFENIFYHIKGSTIILLPQLATTFCLQVDKIMLRYMCDDISQVSYYDYGEKIVTIPLTFITVLSTVMMPRIANEYAKSNTKEVKRLLDSAGGFSLMLAVPMMVGVALCAKNLIPWYLGTEYAPTINVMICISPIIVLNSLDGISGKQYLISTNQLKKLSIAHYASAVLNIILNAVLIPIYGCVGAGIATSASSALSVLIQYYFMHKQIGIYVFIQNGIKYCVYTIPMGIIVYLIGEHMEASAICTIIQVLIGMIVYAVLLFVTSDSNFVVAISKIKSYIKK